MNVVFLNGEFLDRDAARVSVFDRGFMFGDGVYEVIPVYGGLPFRLSHHLARLESSLEAIGIRNPFETASWREVIAALLARNGASDASVYVQVTRGVAERDHVPAMPLTPTVFVMCKPLPVNRGQAEAVITLSDYRWQYCHIKAIALLPNVMARQEAARRGAYEAIFVRDGFVTEGAASNVFVVLDGEILTPPQSNLLLPGVTRDFVTELLRDRGEPVRQAPVRVEALERASEVWLTSSIREIVPVSAVDARRYGDGTPGPFWRRAHAAFQDYKARFVAARGAPDS